MTTKQLYLKYQTPNNLQKHMLRVASLSLIILDNLNGKKLSNDDIITCALFHDVAKLVTFNPNKQKQFIKSEKELEKIIKSINKMIYEYGTNEHEAVIKIFQEMGCNKNTIRLIGNLEWIYLFKLLEKRDLESLILIYADMRIGVEGIIPLQDRFEDLRKRAPFDGIEKVFNLTGELESFIQSMVSIDLSLIKNEDIEFNFKSLLNRNMI
jgi:hypothetical protein